MIQRKVLLIVETWKSTCRTCFESSALKEIYRLTKRYPCFIQEWRYQAWNLATENLVTLQVVQEATAEVIPRLDRNLIDIPRPAQKCEFGPRESPSGI
jgi:hypothetical protein